MKKAGEKGVVSYNLHNLFALCGPHERIDGPTFGHGAGVVLRPEIIEKGIEVLEQQSGPAFKIFFSPHGKKLDQDLLKELYTKISAKGHVMLLPARYEGMDSRVEDYYADAVISVGDLVLMGGDVPAMVFLEGFMRLIPGVVGKQMSVERESFSNAFVDYPEYAAPVTWKGIAVPEVLRSGHHQEIENWRQDQAAQRTVYQHFDWLRTHTTTPKQQELVKKYIPAHYVVLMHTQVMLPGGQEGTTSVTSIDIHDIARSAKTFGLKNYFIVTPLADQQNIVQTLLDFWQKGNGVSYNFQRHEALQEAALKESLQAVIDAIEVQEGKKPILIATSAKKSESDKLISFDDQAVVWQEKRPVLFILGTGHGLSPELLEKCDYILLPIEGFSDFNHLSVRSAAAIIFDRWLGVNLRSGCSQTENLKKP